jgi:hypothetical protein
MSSATLVTQSRGLLRHSRWDALLIALAVGHGALLFAVPTAAIVAVGLWWNANTISHYFIHKPFFRSHALNTLFSIGLSLLLGIPQEFWRQRHLNHHFGKAWDGRRPSLLKIEVVLVLASWTALVVLAPRFFLTAYVPGYVLGLGLCWLHGHYEHARGTTSHYGRLYNLLFFNDGYHVEHHLHPNEHWLDLPRRASGGTDVSHWPAVLRWLDMLTLEALERRVLQSRLLQRIVLGWHAQAFRRLLPELPPNGRIGIVGGGLFPRTVLILRRLLPEARLIIIDLNGENIRMARTFVARDVQCIQERYDPARVHDLDVLIFPLSFQGDRAAIYRQPGAPVVVVHDWIWRPRGRSAVVSVWLLKRLNLVKR